MIEGLFLLLFVTPFVLLALNRDDAGPQALRVGCANSLMLFYLIADHCGLLWLHYSGDGGVHQLASVSQGTVVLLAFYSNVVVCAYLITGRLIGSSGRRWRTADLERLRSERFRIVPLVLLACLVIPVAVAKVRAGSPLLLLVQGEALAATEARVAEVSTGSWFLGIKPSYLNVLFTMLEYSGYVALVLLFARRRLRYLLLWLLTFVGVALNGFANVSKGFIAIPLMAGWFVYSMVHHRGYLLSRALWWIGAGGLSLIAVFSSWVLGNERIDLLYPVERLVLGNLLPQYVVVDAFGFDNMLYGATVPSWFSFGHHEQFALDVFAWRELMGVTGDYFYTAPSSFVAEAHANFAMLGVFAASVFVFSVLRYVDLALAKIRSEVVFVALTAFTSVYFSKMARAGMVSYIIDYGLWATVAFAFVSYRLVLFSKRVGLINGAVEKSGLPPALP